MNEVIINGVSIYPKDIADTALSFIKNKNYRVHRAIIAARTSFTQRKVHEIKVFKKSKGEEINLLENKIILKRLIKQQIENKRVMISWFFEIENIVRETISIKHEAIIQN